MTRAGRILGVMMPRERYERWCAMRGFGARLAGDTSPTAQERAEAKRARKAAKRRRDAALTALGQRESRLWWEGWVTRNMGKAGEAGVLRDDMRAIRCGEVAP